MKNSAVKYLIGGDGYIDDFKVREINRKITKYFSSFVNDEASLITSLLQNPFGKNKDLQKIKKNFGGVAYENMLVLNRLFDLDPYFKDNFQKHKKMIILFLINTSYIFHHKDDKFEVFKLFSKKRIAYAMDLLQKLDVFKLKEDFEDLFFSFLRPKKFCSYLDVFRKSKNTYFRFEERIRNMFEDTLNHEKIEYDTHFRLKNIYSLHKKIIKKGILPSQVLDVIGVRIIVDKKEDCYKVMACIIDKWPVMESKIKDYIAVPKANGYKSLHLTVLLDSNPVEIQIRTKKMHQTAQYGRASHRLYKKGMD
ncbi:MAG: hypothetical protein ACOC1P_01650 [Minisyncoccales bacterium]